MSNTLISNQTNSQQVSRTWDLVDITRIILLLLIITTHTWPIYCQYKFGHNNAPGYIACEAFYIITGFFTAKKAIEPTSIKFYRYGWRRLWNYLPKFIIAILFAVVTFSIASLIYMEPSPGPIIGVIWESWYMWFMFISGTLLYLIIQKGKTKAMFSCLFIGIACFVIMYIAWPPAISFTRGQDNKNWSSLFTVLRGLLRSFGGISLGIFIYWVCLKLNWRVPSKAWQIVFSILTICLSILCLCLIFIWPRTWVDYMVVILFFIIFTLLFIKIGFLSNKISIPKPVTAWCRKYSLAVYTVHGAWVKFWIIIPKHNIHLYDKTWWLWLFGIICYVGAFLVGIAAEQVYKVVKKYILDKCVKLNSI